MTKNKKSVVALIVMSLLLVASIVLGATGAYFTSSANQDYSSSLTFGKVAISLPKTANDATVSNTIDTTETKVLPGSVITFAASTITNNSDVKTYQRYKVVFTITGTDVAIKMGSEEYVSGTWIVCDGALDARAAMDISAITVEVPTSLKDQEATLSISAKLTVQAIQVANTAATAADAFELYDGE